MEDPPSFVSPNTRIREHLEGRSEREKVQRYRFSRAYPRRSRPRLRWQASVRRGQTVLAQLGLADVHTECEQFAVNTGGDPGRVARYHHTDKIAYVLRTNGASPKCDTFWKHSCQKTANAFSGAQGGHGFGLEDVSVRNCRKSAHTSVTARPEDGRRSKWVVNSASARRGAELQAGAGAQGFPTESSSGFETER